MKYQLITSLLFFSSIVFAQETTAPSNTHKGEFSLGIRTTGSLFSASGNRFGIGTGWQFRFRMTNRLNSEWFLDWITTDIGGAGQRYDLHIGESMIIYPGKRIGHAGRFTPYVLGGFCGDYTKIQTNLYFDDEQNVNTRQSKDRWSFATQLGLGSHFNITEQFDISLSAQYVLHFGRDIHAEMETNSLGYEHLHIEEKGDALEGHLFITLSANLVIIDLLKK